MDPKPVPQARLSLSGSWSLQEVAIDLVFLGLTALVSCNLGLWTSPLQEVPGTGICHFATRASGASGLRPAG